MKRNIFQNWGLKLISLILACVIWFLVVQVNDPQDTSSFSNIQVKIVNADLLERENKVYEILDSTDKVRVTVRAPRSILKEMRSSDIVAEADMSKLTDINTIVITYDIQNVDTDSVEISGNHDVVKLNIEEKRSKYIPVDYTVVGEITEGYFLGNISLGQNRIEISGAKSSVDEVRSAGVEIDISNETSSLSADMEIHLYDKDHEEVSFSNLKKQMDYVHMSAEILPTKSIPIRAAYSGEPAQGYVVNGNAEVEPSSVLIAGTARVLASVSSLQIPEEDIDITDAEERMVLEFDATKYMPTSIRLADTEYDGKIRVTIPIEKIMGKTLEIPVSNLIIVTAPNEMEVTVEEDTGICQLEISGLNEDLMQLEGSSVRGTIDLKAWMEDNDISELPKGVYSVPVSFNLGEKIEIKQELTVNVRIAEPEE